MIWNLEFWKFNLDEFCSVHKCKSEIVMKSNVATRRSHTINLQTNLDVVSNDLMLECKLCSPGARISKSVRDKITK